jgi:glyceraldehyde 3-phosphate dehydrogenase
VLVVLLAAAFLAAVAAAPYLGGRLYRSQAREVTADEVNDAFARAADAGPMAGVLSYSTDPLVSRDIVGDPSSCVFDSGLTQAAGTLVKVFGWYDNEWGYTCRLADLTAIVGGRL